MMRWRGITAGTALTVLVLAVVSNAQVDTAWVRHYAGPVGVPELSVAIELDALGNVFVGGTCYREGTGDDYAILKYSPDGELQWERHYNGPDDSTDALVDLKLDAQGHVVVTGYSWADTSGYDVATMAFDTDGSLLWVNRHDIDADSLEMPVAIEIDSDGNILIARSRRRSLYSWGDYGAIKLSSSGDFLWAWTGWGGAWRPPCIDTDSAGTIYIGGDDGLPNGEFARLIKLSADGALIFDNDLFWGGGYFSFRDIQVTPAGELAIAGQFGEFFACYLLSSTGAQIWVEVYGGFSIYNEGINLNLDSDGNAYVFGHIYQFHIGGVAYHDCLTTKCDQNGNSLWSQQYNGGTRILDWPLASTLDNEANVYTFAYSQDSLGRYDWVILKYSTDGVPLWEYKLDGSGEDSTTVAGYLTGAIDVAPNGDVFAAGWTYSEASGLTLTTVKLDASCHCPNQGDSEPDGFVTAIDLAALIDALFAGGANPQDVGCPIPRFDLDCDGFTTALDLSVMIDYLFASGVGPCDPCE